eukprot:363372-Chlamydomonas_euryale.AAC.2
MPGEQGRAPVPWHRVSLIDRHAKIRTLMPCSTAVEEYGLGEGGRGDESAGIDACQASTC